MTEVELEFADYFINMLREISPKVESADWYDLESGKKIEKLNKKQIKDVVAILVSQNWINKEDKAYLYSFNYKILSTIKKYGSYSNFYLQNEKILKRREQKEIFDFKTSKWRYYTFLWWFGFAILGGGYSVYDIIERLTTTKTPTQEQISTTTTIEPEVEKQKSQSISVLDQTNHRSLSDSITEFYLENISKNDSSLNKLK